MKSPSSRLLSQPLDRAATTVMTLVALVIVAMLSLGSQTLPRVRSFSWQNRPVSTDDVAFLLTFNQPMEPQSVEENLRIEPALSGKVSWAGRRMAYTLDLPAPYGETYELVLPKAQALSRQEGFEPFISEFKSRDRVFAYIGAGDEAGRLILFNLTKKEKTLLTPEDQLVLDFQPYPGRDRILFSAVSAKADIDRAAAAQIYSVTTGLGAELPRPGALPGQSSAIPSVIPRWQFWRRQADLEAGKTELILDNQDYQNLNFDLSPDGKTIVVQRVRQNDPADFGQWILQAGQPARKLDTEPGGDFKIAPDSQSLLLQQGEGTAILSLDPKNAASKEEPTGQTAQNGGDTLIDFLPDYGLALDVASDGSSAALVNFNQDDPDKRFTQTLFLVSNRGEERPLLDTDGTIISAQFNENNTLLYSLITQVVQAEASDSSSAESELDPLEGGDEGNYENSYEDSYLTSAFLAAINVETGEAQKLIELPPQSQIEIDLAPDGLAILFDETLEEDEEISDSETSQYDGPSHRLWLLPLFSTLEERRNGKPVSLAPTPLDIAGRHPLWLP